MIKTYLPYEPDHSCCCQRRCRSLPDDHLAYFISCGGPVGHVEGHRSLRAGTARRAAVSSTDDGQGVALWLLRGGGVLTPHRPASPRGHRASGCWRRTTHRTSGPSPTFARIMWMRCRACSYRYWRWSAGGAGEAGARGAGRPKVKANASKHKALPTDKGEGSAVGGGGSGVVATGPGSG